ncbi:MAG TPA: hydrolase 1, exosortase A system-associated [Sedimenticola thiotaurini]|uniref:Hydrolase 1, exosortase A system-associated n=1 Tax=Sedimenticola thiotaurini TaxID=1543721 RepID=A0A831RP97_9GAMM|nr:hydrolase 1, exosortase A system-associated [Sedimenticola thiotaurini]
MTATEKAICFQCNGSPLVGILHRPEHPARTGVVIVDAGGPQYRVGVARQLVQWARTLAEGGVAVLRFDYRGFGDSGGPYLGFEHIDDDIRAAVDVLNGELPGLEEIVLWGECNAASAILMYAWRDQRVKRLVLQNPWVRSEETQARTYIRHYYWYRLRQRSFWRKLLHFEFNPVESLQSLFGLLRKSRAGTGYDEQSVEKPDIDPDLPYQVRMREGLGRFDGEILLFMSGRSLIGRELDEAVAGSERWKEVVSGSRIERVEMKEADHTFSRSTERRYLIERALSWLAGGETGSRGSGDE